MELLSLVKEMFQNMAEHAASYRVGQTVLRYLDRSLWVIEKCARWAVPPPLDQDERPQPELVRPLPWVFFLMMLVVLRVTRESISLLNLALGKPPLRSADVVMYIQSKRRYLRTLKYQGTRVMRARVSEPRDSWRGAFSSMLDVALCFRAQRCGNNNTTTVANNEEILVVKRSKRGRQHSSPVVSTESTMERLIEKMMINLDAESDEDSSFTLTNVTSAKSDQSDFTVESDQDTTATYPNNITKPLEANTPEPETFNMADAPSSTPEQSPEISKENVPPMDLSPKEVSKAFIQQETSKIPRTPNNESKIANGRTVKSVPSKKKGSKMEKDKRTFSDTHVAKHGAGNNTSL